MEKTVDSSARIEWDFVHVGLERGLCRGLCSSMGSPVQAELASGLFRFKLSLFDLEVFIHMENRLHIRGTNPIQLGWSFRAGCKNIVMLGQNMDM